MPSEVAADFLKVCSIDTRYSLQRRLTTHVYLKSKASPSPPLGTSSRALQKLYPFLVILTGIVPPRRFGRRSRKMSSTAEIASAFIEGAPPGELSDVVGDIKALTKNESTLIPKLEPAFQKYSEEQLTTTNLPGSSQSVCRCQHQHLVRISPSPGPG